MYQTGPFSDHGVLNGTSTAPVAPPVVAPPPPAPGQAPPTETLPPGKSGDDRSAFLGSIAGFNKKGLKKSVTVDKSAPQV